MIEAAALLLPSTFTTTLALTLDRDNKDSRDIKDIKDSRDSRGETGVERNGARNCCHLVPFKRPQCVKVKSAAR